MRLGILSCYIVKHNVEWSAKVGVGEFGVVNMEVKVLERNVSLERLSDDGIRK